jgi:hypothetical protein
VAMSQFKCLSTSTSFVLRNCTNERQRL